MYTINGNRIYWPAKDVTPIILNCGIKYLTFGSNIAIELNGGEDVNTQRIYRELIDNLVELPNVYGYPNRIVPAPHDNAINILIVPSPHINPTYVTDCQKLLTKGYPPAK